LLHNFLVGAVNCDEVQVFVLGCYWSCQ